MASNVQRPWGRADYSRLESKGLGSTRQEAVRRLIELALLEKANRSNRSIARLVGCRHETVQPVRERLEETGEIRQFEPVLGGRGKTERTERTRALRTTITEAQRAEIENRLEQGQSKAQIKKDMLGGSGHSSSAIDKIAARREGRQQPPSPAVEPEVEVKVEVESEVKEPHACRGKCEVCGELITA